jgi:RNase H-like domain found in reverse transcriptase/Integrase zinc binding domain/Chromo (CHRromatin Organisation MOdifier) domain
MLSQQQDDGKWRPIGCLSKGFADAETRYEVHDRELLAIIRPLQEFRHWLTGTKHPVTVLTDHRNLNYFKTKQFLTDRQTRWMEFLSKFDLQLRYRPGRQSSVPDLLSRRVDHQLEKEAKPEEARVLIPDSMIHPDQRITTLQLQAPTVPDELYKAQAADPLILSFNMTTEGSLATIPDGWAKPGDLWTYRGKIYIPEEYRQTIFRALHRDPAAAHPGRDATLYSVRRDYYWPRLRQDIEEWIRNCDICQRTKIHRRKPQGELKPIDPTPRPWGVVTTDLITGLPPCKGYDSIWTVTDKRGKLVHLAPTTATLDSEGLYHLYLQNVWKLHGLSDKIISDRGPQYASRFAKEANRNLGIETALSTAYHPQTDGQSERTNQEVEQALRTVVSFHQDDWVDWLPVVEFALNNRYHKSLKTTPFYANYGFHPHIGSLPRIETPIESVEDFVSHLQQVQKDTAQALTQAAADMKRFYDKHRGPAPEFAIGQKVLLDNADLAINRPSRKLAERRSGPFKVLAKVGTHAYRLELPPQWKNVHPVFHVSKLDPYHEDPKDPNHPEPPPDVIEGEPEWEVEKILDAKFAGQRLKFLVKWFGWPDSENTWQDEVDLEHAKEMIEEFYRDHPSAPRRLPDGSRSGDQLTRRRRRKCKNINGIDFIPLDVQTNVSRWPMGPLSRDAKV